MGTSSNISECLCRYTLQRYYCIPKIRYKIIPEKELRGLSPNSYIHVSVCDFYIPTVGLPILLQENRWEYIDLSQTHICGNWDGGRAVPFLGTHTSKFLCSVGYQDIPYTVNIFCDFFFIPKETQPSLTPKYQLNICKTEL